MMNSKGISWSVIASYYGVSVSTLTKHRKHFGKTNNNLL